MRGPVGRKLCSHPLMSPSVMDFTRGNTPGIRSALAPSPELLLRRADLRAGLRRGFARLSARIIASSSLSMSKSVPHELPRASDERLLRLLQLRTGMVKLLSPLLLPPPPPPPLPLPHSKHCKHSSSASPSAAAATMVARTSCSDRA
jgi:hypothetical protein